MARTHSLYTRRDTETPEQRLISIRRPRWELFSEGSGLVTKVSHTARGRSD